MNPPRPRRSRPRLRERLALGLPSPILVPLIGASLGCAACATPDVGSVRSEVEAVTRRWERSLEQGDPARVVSEVFTEDAIRLPAGEPVVRGREAISAALEGSAALTEARFQIEELEVDGDLAFARGTYAVRTPDGQRLAGKFLEVWKRTDAGWRIHRVMWD